MKSGKKFISLLLAVLFCLSLLPAGVMADAGPEAEATAEATEIETLPADEDVPEEGEPEAAEPEEEAELTDEEPDPVPDGTSVSVVEIQSASELSEALGMNPEQIRYKGDAEFVFSDVTIPADVRLDMGGRAVSIPAGVTVTVQGELQEFGQMTLSGELFVTGNAFGDSMVLAGTLRLGDYWNGSVNVAGLTIEGGSVVATENRLRVSREVTSASGIRDAASLADSFANVQNVGVQAFVRSELTLSEDMELPESLELIVEPDIRDGGAYDPATLTIRGAVTMHGRLGIYGGSVVVENRLTAQGVNIGVRDDAKGHLTVSGGVLEIGDNIHIEGGLTPETALTGVDLSGFTQYAKDDWIDLQPFDSGAQFADFSGLEAIVDDLDGEEWRRVEYIGDGEFTFASIELPENLEIGFRGNPVVIPADATVTVGGWLGDVKMLTVNGALSVPGDLNIDVLALGESASLTVGVRGNVNLSACEGDLGRVEFETIDQGDWQERGNFTFQCDVFGEYDLDALRALAKQYSGEQYENFGVRGNICGDIAFENDVELPEKTQLSVGMWWNETDERDEPARLTVKNLSFAGQLDVRGGTLTVTGLLTNNGRIDISVEDRGEDGRYNGRIEFTDGGAYDYENSQGEIELHDFITAAEALGEGFDTSGFSVEHRDGEDWTKLRPVDRSREFSDFDGLKAIIDSMEEGGERVVNYVGSGAFTFDADIEIPDGVSVFFFGTDTVVIPENVTVTNYGFMLFDGELEVGGTYNEYGTFGLYAVTGSGDVNICETVNEGGWVERRGQIIYRREARSEKELHERIESLDGVLPDGYTVEIVLVGAQPLTEDLTIPEGFSVMFSDASFSDFVALTVPAGVTVTNYGSVYADCLIVGGTFKNGGYVELNGYEGSGTFISIAPEATVCIWLYTGTLQAIYDAAAMAETLPSNAYEPVVYVQSDGDFTLTKDLTIPENMLLRLCTSEYGMSRRTVLTVPAGVTVTNNGAIAAVGGGMDIYGSLKNDGEIVLGDALIDELGTGLITIHEGAVYGGSGVIMDFDSEAEHLSGFDRTRFRAVSFALDGIDGKRYYYLPDNAAQAAAQALETAAAGLAEDATDAAIREAVSVIDVPAEQLAEAIFDADTGLVDTLAALEQQLSVPPEVAVGDTFDSEQVFGESFDSEQVVVIGAGLNAPADETKPVKLVIDEAKQVEAVPERYDADTAIVFSMTLENVKSPKELSVPVAIILPIPATIDAARLVILHYTGDGEPEVVKHQVFEQDGQLFVAFVVTGFSDFAIVEGKVIPGDVDGDLAVTPADAARILAGDVVPVGNINNDETTDKLDAALILQTVVGLYPKAGE